ncbi:MAG TPA: hypothetical protein VF077_00375 [Nitrospiraceae bacterium]
MKRLLTLFLLVLPLFAQPPQPPAGSTGPTLPPTCFPGQLWNKTGENPGIYVCNKDSQWELYKPGTPATIPWGTIIGNINAQIDLANALAGKAALAHTHVIGDVASLQAELDKKAPLNNPKFTGTVEGVTKGMVGLGNVDNTSDASKPVSTDTQAVLDTKAPLDSPQFTGTVQGVTKAMVGLGNVDNTSDVNKPVSTATQTAINAKESVLTFSAPLSRSVNTITLPVYGSGNRPVAAASLGTAGNCVQWGAAGIVDTGLPCGTGSGNGNVTGGPTLTTAGRHTKVTGAGAIGESIVNDNGTDAFVNANRILTAANYNSYSPTLTGGGASGTWGIAISGNAATATSATSATTAGSATSATTASAAPWGGITGKPAALANITGAGAIRAFDVGCQASYGTSCDNNGNGVLDQTENATNVNGGTVSATTGTFSGLANFTGNQSGGSIAAMPGGLGAGQFYTTGANSAVASFHRGGNYAVYLGLDTDNVMKIGGWSAGAVAYPIITSLDVDAAATANKIVRRDPSGYIFNSYINTSAPIDNTGMGAVLIERNGDGFIRKVSNYYAFQRMAESVTQQFSFGYGGSASVAIDATTFHYIVASKAYQHTVTEVFCQTDTGTVVLNLLRSDGGAIFTPAVTCNSSGVASANVTGYNWVPYGMGIGFQTSSVSGTKNLSVTVKYTRSY